MGEPSTNSFPKVGEARGDSVKDTPNLRLLLSELELRGETGSSSWECDLVLSADGTSSDDFILSGRRPLAVLEKLPLELVGMTSDLLDVRPTLDR